MANTIITALGLTREALRILTNNLRFTRNCYKGYSANNYGNADPKEGNVLNVRLPNRYKSFIGSTISVQNVTEYTVPIELTTQRNIPLFASSVEYTLDIDNFSRLYIQPMMAQMANDIDFDGTDLYKKVWNQVGTPGSTPNSTTVYLQAGQVLDDNAVPRDDQRRFMLTPSAMAATVDNLKGLFQQSDEIGRQYKTGQMGSSLGGTFEMDQNLKLHTCGNFGTSCSLYEDMVEGGNTIVLNDFVGVIGTPSANEGDILTIENVYGVNPANKQSTGRLQQFVVVSSVWDGVNARLTVTVNPYFKASQLDPWQNITALGVADADVSFEGDQNSTYPINLAFHTDAFVFVSANLYMPKDTDFSAQESADGVSLRIVRKYDVMTDVLPCRTDVLYGFACPRPEMACRIIG